MIDFQSIFRARIFDPEEALNSNGVTARYKNYMGVGLGSLSKVGPPWLTTEGLPKFKLGSNLLDILCTLPRLKPCKPCLNYGNSKSFIVSKSCGGNTPFNIADHCRSTHGFLVGLTP